MTSAVDHGGSRRQKLITATGLRLSADVPVVNPRPPAKRNLGQPQWAAHTVTVKDQPAAAGYEHTLLIRRARTAKVTKKHPDGIYEIEYFLVHARTGTRIPAMIAAAGLRWNIEDDNKTGKDLLGLDHYQVRNWTPWHRHVSICMLAHAFLAVTRAGLGKDHRPRSTPPMR